MPMSTKGKVTKVCNKCNRIIDSRGFWKHEAMCKGVLAPLSAAPSTKPLTKIRQCPDCSAKFYGKWASSSYNHHRRRNHSTLSTKKSKAQRLVAVQGLAKVPARPATPIDYLRQAAELGAEQIQNTQKQIASLRDLEAQRLQQLEALEVILSTQEREQGALEQALQAISPSSSGEPAIAAAWPPPPDDFEPFEPSECIIPAISNSTSA